MLSDFKIVLGPSIGTFFIILLPHHSKSHCTRSIQAKFQAILKILQLLNFFLNIISGYTVNFYDGDATHFAYAMAAAMLPKRE